jgi:hypothetical protein
MATPTVAWDETAPADTDNRYAGEAEIREFKTQVRELMNVDHQMDYVYGTSQQDTDWGWHKKLSLRSKQSTPTAKTDSMILYSQKKYNSIISDYITELFVVDETGDVQQLTSNGDFIGGMVGELRIWRGTLSSIPPGWTYYYNANTSLLGFVKGITTSTTEPGSTGGSNTMTLSPSQCPAHTHSLTGSSTHNHMALAVTGSPSDYAVMAWSRLYTKTWQNGYIVNGGEGYDGSHTHISLSAGSGSSFNNQPVYYTVALIEKT